MERIKEFLKKYNIFLIVIALVLIITWTSYAFINFDMNGGKINNLTTPEITLSYDESGASLNIDEKIETDEEGKALSYYTFEVSGTSSVEYPMEYTIYLSEDDSNTLTSANVKFYLTKVYDNVETEVVAPISGAKLRNYKGNEKDLILYQTNFDFTGTNSFSDEYRLRAWVDANNDFEIEPDITQNGTTQDIIVNSLTYKFKLNVSSKRYVVFSLSDAIMSQGVVSSGDGLYVSNETNDGKPTYYYHGKVENNYVFFAGLTWRVVRINENGTIRMITEDVIENGKRYDFNTSYYNNYKYMYYSESNVDGGIMKILEDWYDEYLSSYDGKIATSTYCEQAKVKLNDNYTSGNATMKWYSKYTPDFKCSEDDGNEKGIVNSKVGLISVDEALHAGGIFYENNDYYLAGNFIWTMSPAGFYNNVARVWNIGSSGNVINSGVEYDSFVRIVISLEADTLVSGSGSIDDMWIVK